MLYHIGIILAVTLFSVNAALVVNVYDDGQVQSLNSESDCNYQACDQLCRRLGFPGGACVGDRCECDNFKQLQGQEQFFSFGSSCNYQACDQLCRRLGFPGGACVNDRCKCDNFRQFQDVNEVSLDDKVPVNLNDLRDEMKPESNEIPADRKVFVDINDLPDGENHANVRSSVSRGSCDCVPRDCDRYCFRLHYTGGICVTGQCRCYK